jgi:hypothetical protein
MSGFLCGASSARRTGLAGPPSLFSECAARIGASSAIFAPTAGSPPDAARHADSTQNSSESLYKSHSSEVVGRRGWRALRERKRCCWRASVGQSRAASAIPGAFFRMDSNATRPVVMRSCASRCSHPSRGALVESSCLASGRRSARQGSRVQRSCGWHLIWAQLEAQRWCCSLRQTSGSRLRLTSGRPGVLRRYVPVRDRSPHPPCIHAGAAVGKTFTAPNSTGLRPTLLAGAPSARA